ncbi:MAG: hypothetical protein AAF533_27250 [Acidobacteriota bacterium]
MDGPMDGDDSLGFRARILTRARDWKRQFFPLHVFGGQPLMEAELPLSPHSGLPLHLTLDIDLEDPALSFLGIKSVRRLAVLANYHLDAATDPLFVKHLDEGRALELLSEPAAEVQPGVPAELPQLPVELEALSEAEMAVESVDELPSGLGPLHQVGGHPVWINDPLPPPRCPETDEEMRFIACVDSERRFPTGNAEVQLLFGDCGMLYVYWSEAASISAAVVQSY